MILQNGNHMKNKLLAAFRWILVLPAAVVASCLLWGLVDIGTSWFPGRATLPSDSFFVMAFKTTIGSIFSALGFVIGGAKTAPSRREVAAKVLAILCIAGAGALLAFNIYHTEWWSAWASICTIVGASLILINEEWLQ